MLGELVRDARERLAHLGQLRVGVTVGRRDLLDERPERRQLLPEVGVMMPDDVVDERGDRLFGPVDVLRPGRARLAQRRDHGVDVEAPIGAGGIERGLATTAVVDAEALEDAGPAGVLEDERGDVGVG